MKTNSQKLRNRIALAMPNLMSVGHELTTHGHFAEIYPNYLFTLHCMIRASVPLMETAMTQVTSLPNTDALRDGLVAYLSKHVHEEMHHDDWLLDDLETIGYKRNQILAQIPSPTVAALVGSQYYWMNHYHPVTLLGYISILEGYPPTIDQIEEMIRNTGYPRDAFRTLHKHAYLDPRHRDDLNSTLDDLPLTDTQISLLGVSALQTISFISEALSEVLSSYVSEEFAVQSNPS